MRRISTGIVGRELLGRFTTFDNSLRSIENNQDIVLNPNGSGIVRADAHIQVNDENSVRFADSGSSNYVEIKAPASLGSNITLTLPDSTTAGNVLTTDGSGNLTFSDLTIEVSNQTADTTAYYPLLSTSNSGSISSVDTASSKLSFQPSSGNLTVTQLTTGSADINGGSIDGATIGSNSPSTGNFTSLTGDDLTVSNSVDINATSTTHAIRPNANNTYDLGTSSLRWRDIYTNDLNLSNGIGDYTIVEGEEDLFLYNNKNKRVYKFVIAEVDPQEAPAKSSEV